MKLILIVLLALFAAANANLVTRSVSLRLDHFNPLDRRTFDARYFHNSEHYLPGGPIFIYVSGGVEAYDDFLTRGAVFEIAEDTRGHLFSLEHRYYGTSRPTDDASAENLRWLTVQQALGDLAQFISFVRSNYYGAQNSRVILWGRGYGGALAVWARQKYPNLVDGVWASSAYVNAILEYPQFMRNTFYTIRSIGDDPCGDVLNGAFRFIEDSIRRRNVTYVEERLRLCQPLDINSEEDIARMYFGIASNLGYAFVSNSVYPDIDEKCRLMLEYTERPPDNPLDAFARWFVDQFHSELECLNYDLAIYENAEWDSISTDSGRRQNRK
jgi:thymus-specific serine protease